MKDRHICIHEVVKNVLNIDELEPDVDIRTTYGLDSLDMVQLIYHIEEEFDISITSEDFDKLSFNNPITINELCVIVNKYC